MNNIELIRFQRREEGVSAREAYFYRRRLGRVREICQLFTVPNCPFCQTSLRLDLQNKHPRLKVQYYDSANIFTCHTQSIHVLQL